MLPTVVNSQTNWVSCNCALPLFMVLSRLQNREISKELERRPSTLRLDHACVCIAKRQNLLAPPPISLEPGGDRRSNDISLSVRAVEICQITGPRGCRRCSPPWTARAPLKVRAQTSTLGHTTKSLHAAHHRKERRLVFSNIVALCGQVLRQRICYYLVGSALH